MTAAFAGLLAPAPPPPTGRRKYRKGGFIWLHPTKGWRGAVYHPKRGRARPIRQALLNRRYS